MTRFLARLRGADDWQGFVDATALGVHLGLDWQAIEWRVDNPLAGGAPALGVDPGRPDTSGLGGHDALDFGGRDALPLLAQGASTGTGPGPLRWPATLADVVRLALLHSDPGRQAVAYRMARRVQHAPAVAQDTLHPDFVALSQWARQVRRDMHKMKAFVRFTRVASEAAGPAASAGGDAHDASYVAWFEPRYTIVRAVAPFFARRFTGMRWAILTPQASVRWDGQALHHAPGAGRDAAPPADADERLWLTYYQRIFNPARVKVAAMKREMPVYYWANLPEAQTIAPLLAAAGARVHAMASHTDTERRHARSRAVPDAARGASHVEGGDAAPGDDGCRVVVPSSTPPSLIALRRQAADCDRCEFACDATQTVWGEGAPDARLMIVGEQPGDREDLEGRPFVGPAGALLRRAMDELGWDARTLYLTNAVKHFKFTWRGKRRMHKTAAQREIDECSAWLDAEIAAVAPATLLALGTTAASSLLGRTVRMREVVDAPQRSRHGVPMFVAPHPSSLLRAGIEPGSAPYRQWVALLARAQAASPAPSPGEVALPSLDAFLVR